MQKKNKNKTYLLRKRSEVKKKRCWIKYFLKSNIKDYIKNNKFFYLKSKNFLFNYLDKIFYYSIEQSFIRILLIMGKIFSFKICLRLLLFNNIFFKSLKNINNIYSNYKKIKKHFSLTNFYLYKNNLNFFNFKYIRYIEKNRANRLVKNKIKNELFQIKRYNKANRYKSFGINNIIISLNKTRYYFFRKKILKKKYYLKKIQKIILNSSLKLKFYYKINREKIKRWRIKNFSYILTRKTFYSKEVFSKIKKLNFFLINFNRKKRKSNNIKIFNKLSKNFFSSSYKYKLLFNYSNIKQKIKLKKKNFDNKNFYYKIKNFFLNLKLSFSINNINKFLKKNNNKINIRNNKFFLFSSGLNFYYPILKKSIKIFLFKLPSTRLYYMLDRFLKKNNFLFKFNRNLVYKRIVFPFFVKKNFKKPKILYLMKKKKRYKLVKKYLYNKKKKRKKKYYYKLLVDYYYKKRKRVKRKKLFQVKKYYFRFLKSIPYNKNLLFTNFLYINSFLIFSNRISNYNYNININKCNSPILFINYNKNLNLKKNIFNINKSKLQLNNFKFFLKNRKKKFKKKKIYFILKILLFEILNNNRNKKQSIIRNRISSSNIFKMFNSKMQIIYKAFYYINNKYIRGLSLNNFIFFKKNKILDSNDVNGSNYYLNMNISGITFNKIIKKLKFNLHDYSKNLITALNFEINFRRNVLNYNKTNLIVKDIFNNKFILLFKIKKKKKNYKEKVKKKKIIRYLFKQYFYWEWITYKKKHFINNYKKNFNKWGERELKFNNKNFDYTLFIDKKIRVFTNNLIDGSKKKYKKQKNKKILNNFSYEYKKKKKEIGVVWKIFFNQLLSLIEKNI